MQITCYLYSINPNRKFNLDFSEVKEITNILNEVDFYGNDKEKRFGFIKCGSIQNYVYGFFIQHYLEEVEYCDDNKKLIQEEQINSEKFVFYINFYDNHVLLQSRKDSDLPKRKEIVNRFVNGFNEAMQGFSENIKIEIIEEAIKGEEREEILKEFYTTEGRVTEVNAEEFQEELFREDFTWFNPDDKFPDAMKQTGELFIEHTNEINAEANETGNLQKVPPIRYAMETASNPQITVTIDGMENVLSSKEEIKFKINFKENAEKIREEFINFIKKADEKIPGDKLKPIEPNKSKEDDGDDNGQLSLF